MLYTTRRCACEPRPGRSPGSAESVEPDGATTSETVGGLRVAVPSRPGSRPGDRARGGTGHDFRSAWCRCRSEEHTSELQSHSDLVCRLLLEKKKEPILPSACAHAVP